MPDSFILMVMGGGFIAMGLGMFFWGRREEKSYYNSLSSRPDVREFLEHSPDRPEHSSLRIGGWIGIILGSVLLSVGGGLRLWG